MALSASPCRLTDVGRLQFKLLFRQFIFQFRFRGKFFLACHQRILHCFSVVDKTQSKQSRRPTPLKNEAPAEDRDELNQSNLAADRVTIDWIQGL